MNRLSAAIVLSSAASGLAAFCSNDMSKVCDAKYKRYLGATATCEDVESIVRRHAQCYVNVGCKQFLSSEFDLEFCSEYGDSCEETCRKTWTTPDALEPRQNEDLSEWDTCDAGSLAFFCAPFLFGYSCEEYAAESESILTCAARYGCELDLVRDTFYDYHCNALAALVTDGPCSSTCASVADAWAENAPPTTLPTFPFPDELCDPSQDAACGVAQVFNNVNCSGDAAWTTPVPVNTIYNDKPPRHYVGVHPAEATVPGRAQGLVSSGAICDQDESDCTERILLPLHTPRTCVAVGERSVLVDFDYRQVGVCDVGEDNCGLIEFGTKCTADGIDSQSLAFFRVPDGECHAFGPYLYASLACDGDNYAIKVGCDASCENCRAVFTLAPGQCEVRGTALARNTCGSGLQVDPPGSSPSSSPSAAPSAAPMATLTSAPSAAPTTSSQSAAPTTSSASALGAQLVPAVLACLAANFNY